VAKATLEGAVSRLGFKDDMKFKGYLIRELELGGGGVLRGP